MKLLAVCFLVLLVTACQTGGDASPGGQENQPNEQTDEANQSEQNRSSGQGEPYTVTDDMGNEVTFEKVPETVVSLQPSNTEILFALGVGDKIVGVTQFDNYPEEAQKIERVSDSVNINAERIIELDPDVVFAYTVGAKESIQPLADAGIPVFVIQSASSFEDVYGDIAQMAEVMGVKEKGEALINEIRAQVEAVEEKVKTIDQPKRIYLEISPAPDIYTAGSNTFQHEILQKAGVENIFGDQEGWIKVSEEEVIKRNPDLIATTVHLTSDPVAEIKGRQGWQDLDAVQQGEVYQLDEEIMTRPGPRIGQAVELVAKIAYPELFN
jgi:iron complex transport system substrate-binding protein